MLFRRGLDARGASERARAHAGISAPVTRIPVGGSLVSLWDGFDASERRDVLAGFLDRVEVNRGASSNLAEHTRVFWADGALADVADDEHHVRVAAA